MTATFQKQAHNISIFIPGIACARHVSKYQCDDGCRLDNGVAAFASLPIDSLTTEHDQALIEITVPQPVCEALVQL
ncbi:hypothetical protein HED52_14780 [Ochrobactrum ciceri]|uniref:Uncharacterized protein n=1 Tax=Brucella ciceri TaxID=391287 RepID=A0ABX1DUQ5_9HYPH|nr:hypothetical protein [Brucella ciceri]